MVERMEEFFGSCTFHGECEAACPKRISLENIVIMNGDYVRAKFRNRRVAARR